MPIICTVVKNGRFAREIKMIIWIIFFISFFFIIIHLIHVKSYLVNTCQEFYLKLSWKKVKKTKPQNVKTTKKNLPKLYTQQVYTYNISRGWVVTMPETVEEKPKKTSEITKKTILVVDDEPDIRESVRMILQMNGYKVLIAVDGDDALVKIQEEKPDLILLDIMMPGTPIGEIVNQIKDIKIAFMSVVRISDARKKGLCTQENIVDFFQKPFNVNDLVSRVELILTE